MNYAINNLFSGHLATALSSTLIHSLWQGALLSAITGLIMTYTRKSSSAKRYNLLVAAMALFAIAVAGTFIIEVNKGETAIPVSVRHYTVNPGPGPAAGITVYPAAPVVSAAPVTITETISSYLNRYAATIVLIWFLIVCVRCIRLASGLHSVYNLRHKGVSGIGSYWEERVWRLSKQMGIKRLVGILESAKAKTPMVIGHLKPLILVPLGMLASLSAEEAEAILLHELAHIRRADYLVNLLQNLMEIVFFFNPAVLWLSALIKAERENCCDDIALARSSKVNYLKALVACGEYNQPSPAYAMAIKGSNGGLKNRVSRIISNKNTSMNGREKSLLAVCLVLLGLGVSAFTARKQITSTVHSVVAAIRHESKVQAKQRADKAGTAKKKALANDTPNQAQQLRRDTSKTTGSNPLVALVNNVDSLRANSSFRWLPANSDTINPLNKSILQNAHNIARELYRERLLTDTNDLHISLNERELIVNGVRMPEQVHQRMYRRFGRTGAENGSYSVNNENGGKYSGNYTNTYAPVPPTIVVPDFGDTLVKYGVIKDKRHIHAVFNNHELVINGVRQPDDVFQMLYKKYAPNYGDNVNISYTNNGLPDKRMEQNTYWAGQQRKIIDQMQREGLINGRAGLSFTLTDKQFIINGAPQSNEVFERYHQEYVPANAGDDWVWNYSNGEQNYPAYANGYRDQGAYYQMRADERRRQAEETDKKLVADLLKDGLITDPNNVSVSFDGKGMTVNGKKQSAELYKKYKDKYRPNTSGNDWSWSYSHHE